MALPPHGISRSRFQSRPAVLSGNADADIRALAQALAALTQRLDQTEDRLVRRINEMLLSGPLAQRPAAGVADRVFYVIDADPGQRLYFDNGTDWVQS